MPNPNESDNNFSDAAQFVSTDHLPVKTEAEVDDSSPKVGAVGNDLPSPEVDTN